MLKNASITRNFALIAGAALVLLAGAIALVMMQTRSIMLDQKRAEIRNTVDAAVSVLQGAYESAKAGGASDAGPGRKTRAWAAASGPPPAVCHPGVPAGRIHVQSSAAVRPPCRSGSCQLSCNVGRPGRATLSPALNREDHAGLIG